MQRSSSVRTSDRLSRSIYGARHVSFFDWSLSQIETSLRLPCTFPIKTNLLLSFLHFPAETYCQSAIVIVVRATRQHCLTDRRHTYPVHLLCPSLTKKFGKCSSSRSLADSFFYLNFLDFTRPSLLLDPSESFRFYHLM